MSERTAERAQRSEARLTGKSLPEVRAALLICAAGGRQIAGFGSGDGVQLHFACVILLSPRDPAWILN